MAITKEKKVEILAKLKNEVVKAKTIVFVHFKGLPVAEANNLRQTLRESATKFLVAKKTLIRKALTEAGLAGELPALDGEVALAYLPAGEAGGDDPLAPPRSVYEYEKKTQGQVKILGGIYESEFRDAAMMITLAQIPSREVLLGQLVGLLQSPIRGLAVALSEIAKQKS